MRQVALIAGHTGPKTGACSPQGITPTLDEGTETIWLRDEINKHLKAKYNVSTVIDENKTKLTQVIAFLKRKLFGEDLSIDIHFNAAASKNANGSEVLIPSNPTSFEKRAAQEILFTITSILGTRTRGVKSEGSGQHSKLGMLSGFDAQNILIEVCFCSNQDDCRKYFQNRDLLAEKLADTIYKLIK